MRGFNEERFVRARHWYLGAIILLFFGMLYMVASDAAEAPPLQMEWRAIAFVYTHGKYERAIDMFDRAWPDAQACTAAANEGLRAVSPGFKDGDGMFIKCIAVPVLH